ERLASLGARVFLCARRAEELEHHRQGPPGEGYEADGTVCDVASADQIRAFVRAAVDRFGQVDILVNNAGRSGGGATAEIDATSMWLDVINTNLNSVFLMTKEVLTTGGCSPPAGAASSASPPPAANRAWCTPRPTPHSKHGVVGFTKALGLELARTGITVNAVCPGFVETPMAEKVREHYAGIWGVSRGDPRLASPPVCRWAAMVTTREVAAMVEYLVGDTPPPSPRRPSTCAAGSATTEESLDHAAAHSRPCHHARTHPVPGRLP
ncbi:SDR family NAD(P)-dependent oxidoreductase, partial [Streptomyces sp. L7]